MFVRLKEKINKVNKCNEKRSKETVYLFKSCFVIDTLKNI